MHISFILFFYQWTQIYVESKKRVKKPNVYTHLFRALGIHMKKTIRKKNFYIKSKFDHWQDYQKADGNNGL